MPHVANPQPEEPDAGNRQVRICGFSGAFNVAELSIIESNLRSTGMWREQGDLNHDGRVDAADVALYQPSAQ